jgi:putative restriction endonuclease
MAGISGSGTEGADSVVLSGGYEDDEDRGEVIVYTGHGGNDPNTKRQVADQEFSRGNLALAVNRKEGLPVRVIRGAELDSPYAPERGFRYDGLYVVESY